MHRISVVTGLTSLILLLYTFQTIHKESHAYSVITKIIISLVMIKRSTSFITLTSRFLYNFRLTFLSLLMAEESRQTS